MYRRTEKITRPVSFEYSGKTIVAQEGDTIAAALLGAGINLFRHAREDESARGPYCMIGNCFECLVEIEGLGSRQACRERVKEGARIHPHPGTLIVGEKHGS